MDTLVTNKSKSLPLYLYPPLQLRRREDWEGDFGVNLQHHDGSRLNNFTFRNSRSCRVLSSGVWRKRAGKRPKTGIFPCYIQERCPNDNGTTTLPFSDRHNPNELLYLRQAMAMLHVVYASVSILLDMGGARSIRDLGGIISEVLSKWTP